VLLAADTVELLDVREKDERDEGYIPGSRHIPYRLVRAYRDELENGRLVVTICSTGARAGVAASALAAEGVRARPVLDSGMDDWEARGNTVTAFRRCGGSG
jgi:hydroxyacylglutathione hydrolase